MLQTLPVELLSIIFTLATHSSPESTLNFNFNSILTPLVLSAINRRCRHVALATPALWTSLCITSDDIQHDALDTAHLISTLKRSRNAALDILIDARDPDWDFTEPEITPDSIQPFATYVHPFPATHITRVLTLLLPHVPRWRSFALLTDTWAPMYTALALLALAPAAPRRLEALTLMRCNEFAGYASDFQPATLREPAWLPFGAALASAPTHPVLPKLRHLNLTGVHVDWAALPRLLPLPPTSPNTSGSPDTGLHFLELAYHSLAVRPTPTHFAALLHASPHLRALTLTGSGPLLPPHAPAAPPTPLPHLTSLTLGYPSPQAARLLLRTLAAPQLTALALEHDDHPFASTDRDAADLLAYLAGTADAPDAAKSANAEPTPLFPALTDLALWRVRASADAFAAFWAGAAAARVQRIDLFGGAGAVPGLAVPGPGEAVLCPQLARLCMRGMGDDQLSALGPVVRARAGRGALRVDVYFGSDEGGDGGMVAVGGVEVRVFGVPDPDAYVWEGSGAVGGCREMACCGVLA